MKTKTQLNNIASQMKRSFRRHDKLPRLRKLPKVSELVALQDLDGAVWCCIVVRVEFNKTKKGNDTKVLKAIHVLQGSTIRQVRLSDLCKFKD